MELRETGGESETGTTRDLRGIAASVSRDLTLSLRLASLRMEGFEPGQGREVAGELAEQLTVTARRAVELYHLESLTEAVAISEGPLKIRRRGERDRWGHGGADEVQRLKSHVGGCYNKVGFVLLLECEIQRARRKKTPVSVVLLKLEPADAALMEEVAGYARGCYRLLDVLGTFDDRAVGMMLPDTHRQGAQIAAQRVLSSFSSARDLAGARKAERITLGVGTYPDDATDAADLLSRADERAGGERLVPIHVPF